MDYKTSSKGDYIGKKLKAHSKQLQLYAIGIHQLRGIPYDKIKLEFDMMKYYKVAYLQKNGKRQLNTQDHLRNNQRFKRISYYKDQNQSQN